MTLDRRGIPGCAVSTEEFKPAAAAQGVIEKVIGLIRA
jgi:hypothetical protein